MSEPPSAPANRPSSRYKDTRVGWWTMDTVIGVTFLLFALAISTRAVQVALEGVRRRETRPLSRSR